VRKGRVSGKVAKWVENEAKLVDGVEITMIDLVDYPMPMFDEAGSPQFNPNRQVDPIVKSFSEKVAGCDAIVLVSPEYNRSYSSVVKNALDYLAFELKHKPVMLVTHGSTGGAQAVAHLRGVIPALYGVTLPSAVMLVSSAGHIVNEDGNLDPEIAKNPYGPQASLQKALADLVWHSDAMAAARD
jgi:NAD(P)H-dependent FMN reductase